MGGVVGASVSVGVVYATTLQGGEKTKVTKEKALELIDVKISQFQKVLAEATYDNRYNETYKLAYYGTETLLTELFSKEEAKNFRSRVSSRFAVIGGEIDYAMELQRFKDHVNSCIAQLKVYRERIQNFWGTDELQTVTVSPVIPFVSMSFDTNDKDINEYVTGILKALQIDFETGERYSKESIPEKVQSRIRSSDLFISIFVKRDKIEGGGYTTPSWLHKELGIAQGVKKDVIAWVERDIKDIAGLNYEKEVIYFERGANGIKKGNYSGMLIGHPIAILYFLARKITAEGAEERRVVNRLSTLRVPLRTLRLNSRFGYSTLNVPGSSCTAKSPNSGFRYLSSYQKSNNKIS